MTKDEADIQPEYGGLIFGILLAVVSCLAVWTAYENIHVRERHNVADTASYGRLTECVSFGKTHATQCTSELELFRHGESVAAYELKAQQEMAKWSSLMLIVTGVGVALVAITVWQTRSVLAEAKRTTRAANCTIIQTKRIGDAQTRAYVGIEDVHYCQSSCRNGKGFIAFSIKNFGLTTAMDVTVTTELRYVDIQHTPQIHPFGLIDPQQSVPGVHSLDLEVLESKIADRRHVSLRFRITYTAFNTALYERVADYQIVYDFQDGDRFPFHVMGGTSSEVEREKVKG